MALRVVARSSKYLPKLYSCTKPTSRLFSTTRVLLQQASHQQHQQHQQQQQHHQQQQQQREQQEVLVPNSGEVEPPQELVIEVTDKNMGMLEHKIPIIVDLYSNRETNSPAQTERLTQAVRNAEGAMRLFRLNVDRFPEVLDNMNISPELLPACVFIYGGRPVARYVGKGAVIDPPTLDKYVQGLLKVAGINSTRVVLKSAEQLLETGDIDGARQIYAEILHNKQLKAEAIAFAGLTLCAIKANQIEEAQEFLDIVTKNYKEDLENPYVKKAFAAMDFAKASGNSNEADLKAKLEQNPKDLESKYSLAVLYSATNRPEEAINEAIGMIKIDKQYNEQAARKLVLQIFEMLGAEHPLTIKGRKRLSAVWFF